MTRPEQAPDQCPLTNISSTLLGPVVPISDAKLIRTDTTLWSSPKGREAMVGRGGEHCLNERTSNLQPLPVKLVSTKWAGLVVYCFVKNAWGQQSRMRTRVWTEFGYEKALISPRRGWIYPSCISRLVLLAPVRTFRNCLRCRYFTAPGRGIGCSFQLAITAPLYTITGYCIATAQSWC